MNWLTNKEEIADYVRKYDRYTKASRSHKLDLGLNPQGVRLSSLSALLI